MHKKLLILAIIGVAYQLWSNDGRLYNPGNPPHDQVIMYSLSTCGNCIITARALEREGVEFTEHYIDNDQAAEDELHRKMNNAGLKTSFYYTPVLDVKGEILSNNPKIESILAALNK